MIDVRMAYNKLREEEGKYQEWSRIAKSQRDELLQDTAPQA